MTLELELPRSPSATSRSPSRSPTGETLAAARAQRRPASRPLLGVPAGLVRPDTGRVVLDGRGAHRRRPGPPGPDGRAARPAYGPARPGRRCSSRTSTRSRTSPSGRAARVPPARTARARRPALARRGRRRRAVAGAPVASSRAARPSGSPSPGRWPPTPALLLLDEPMAALDVAVLPALRQTLRRVLADRTAIVVTHDPLDALLLADRVVVLEAGRVVEDGPSTRGPLPAAQRLRGPAGRAQPGRAAPGATVPSSGRRACGVHGLVEGTAPADGDAAIAPSGPQPVAVYRDEVHGQPAQRVRRHDHRGRAARRPDPRARRRRCTPTSPCRRPPSSSSAPGTRVTFTVKATEVAVYGL